MHQNNEKIVYFQKQKLNNRKLFLKAVTEVLKERCCTDWTEKYNIIKFTNDCLAQRVPMCTTRNNY